jgi:hypothetical protein
VFIAGSPFISLDLALLGRTKPEGPVRVLGRIWDGIDTFHPVVAPDARLIIVAVGLVVACLDPHAKSAHFVRTQEFYVECEVAVETGRFFDSSVRQSHLEAQMWPVESYV